MARIPTNECCASAQIDILGSACAKGLLGLGIFENTGCGGQEQARIIVQCGICEIGFVPAPCIFSDCDQCRSFGLTHKVDR